jgi:catechol 2,3-dioxygenase-like lactoylglutathione lyase family enzyme
MPTDPVIPTLPSRDLTETLAFYRSLGFEEVFGQLEPDQYGIVRRGFRELAAKGLPAEGNGNLLRVGWPV